MFEKKISCGYLHDEFSCMFLFYMKKNAGLRSLRLNGNKIGNKGGMYFAQMLQINTTLEALDLGDTDLVCT